MVLKMNLKKTKKIEKYGRNNNRYSCYEKNKSSY